MLQCVVVGCLCCRVFPGRSGAVVAVYFSVLQCVVVCCSVLQCVAVCCSVLCMSLCVSGTVSEL